MVPRGVHTLIEIIRCALDQYRIQAMLPTGIYAPLEIIACLVD